MDEISELDRMAMHYTAKIIGKRPASETLHTSDVTQAFVDGYKAGVAERIRKEKEEQP